MSDLNLTNVTLTDNDLINLVDRIYPEDFISSKPWIQLNSEFYGNNKNLISIFNNTLLDKIEIAITKSNNVLNLFIQTYGNASLGGIKEDFDNIKANLFSESDNINGIKLLEYILAQLDPDTYSSLNGLQDDTFDFSNSIGKRIIPISTIDDVDKVLTVDVDGIAKWLEPMGGSGSVPQVLQDDHRKLLPRGLYVLTTDTTMLNDPMIWMTEIDCGVWE